ncbi:MAG: MFS transporter [Pseudonocardiales bacterium]
MRLWRPSDRAGLWRDRSFRLLWIGQTTAIAGGMIQLVVLPVLMYQLTGSAAQTSLVATAAAVPYLVFGLYAGAVADRSNRRAIMVGCDLASAAAISSIPLAAAFDVLTPAQILVAAALTGTAFVWHDSALFGALPAIVGRDRIADAYTNLISTSQILQVSATAVAGVLIATVGAPEALWVHAVGYSISAVMIGLVPSRLSVMSGPDARPRSLSADIREGLRYVRRHPVIWPLTTVTIGSGLPGGALTGLVVVYGVQQLGLTDDDARIGWLFTALAVGGLAAGLVMPALSRRVSQPLIALFGLSAKIVLLVGIALVSTLAAGVILLAAWGVVLILTRINQITLRQQLTPDRLQGRVNVTVRMINYSGTPLGAAVGGILADQLDVRAALLIMSALLAATAVYAWSSPLRRIDRATIARMQEEAEQAG